MIKNYTISWNQQFIKNNILYIIGESQLNPKKVLEKKLRGGAGQAGGFIGGRGQGKLTGCKENLTAWFDNLEQSLSYKEVQVKKLCSPVKTSCPPVENVNETPSGMKSLKHQTNHC